MPTPLSPSQRKHLAVAGLVVAGAIAVDQLSKRWAVAQLRGTPGLSPIPGVFELEFSFNPGSAFGLFGQYPNARLVFIAITLLSLAYMVWLLWRLPTEGRWSATWGLALMSGGAIGNLVDRLVRVDLVTLPIYDRIPFWALVQHPREVGDAISRGRLRAELPRHGVVDFLVVHYWPGKRWPTFNVADVCLVVGVGLFLLYLLRLGRKADPDQEPLGRAPAPFGGGT